MNCLQREQEMKSVFVVSAHREFCMFGVLVQEM